MKILVLSDDFPPDAIGGAGMMALRISQEFVRQGHEVQVLAATGDPKKVGRSDDSGLRVRRFYSSYHDRWRSYISLWNSKSLKVLRRTLREFKPDIVHAHNVHAHISYIALLLAKKSGAKVYMTAHDIMSFYPGTFTEFINPENLSCPVDFNYRVSAKMLFRKFRYRYNPFRNFFIRKILSRIDGVVAVSEALKEALVQNGIKNFSVVRNGIDSAAWQVAPGEGFEFKRLFGCENCNLVIFGGRLSGAKGGELILKAMKIVAETDSKAKLLVVGRKEGYANKMMKNAETLDIVDKVIFTGWLSEEEMKVAYAAANIAVVPSVCFDSFPNGNLEAFAAGRPVVSSCFGGSREIVQDGINGYIVNPFDVKTLADRITDLLNNRSKAENFGRVGHDLVKKDYSIQNVATQYVRIFSK